MKSEGLKVKQRKKGEEEEEVEAENDKTLKVKSEGLKVKQREKGEGEEEEKHEASESNESAATNKFLSKLGRIQHPGTETEALAAIHSMLEWKPQGYAKKILQLNLANVASCLRCQTPRASGAGYQNHVSKCCSDDPPVPLEYLQFISRST